MFTIYSNIHQPNSSKGCLKGNTLSWTLTEWCARPHKHARCDLHDTKTRVEQTMTSPSDIIATRFAMDVMKQNWQHILVIRKKFCALPWHRSSQMKLYIEAILCLLQIYSGPGSPEFILRADNVPGFRSITQERAAQGQGMSLEFWYVKIINKNPVAEKAILKLQQDLWH